MWRWLQPTTAMVKSLLRRCKPLDSPQGKLTGKEPRQQGARFLGRPAAWDGFANASDPRSHLTHNLDLVRD